MGLQAWLSGVPANTPRAVAFQLKQALHLKCTPAVQCLGDGGDARCLFTSASDHAKAGGAGMVSLFGVSVAISGGPAPAVEKLTACDGRRVSLQIVSDTM